jgi:hypothetical protein
MTRIRRTVLGTLALLLAVAPAWADQQLIAPGTGLQNAVVANTGPNGLCETTAALGDIQSAVLGMGAPFQKEVRCGPDRVADTFAAGDDVQLVAVGAPCKNGSTSVVDTGPNGIADTTADPNDVQIIAVGTAPPNRACVIAGANGVADTAAVAGDDNLVLTPVGAAQAHSDLIVCGPNHIVDTTPNNVNPLGDDVFVAPITAVGQACSTNQVVIESGADGIADTRAEGPDLVLAVAKPVRLTIGKGRPSGTKLVKFAVSNVEFGASAPASRAYRLAVTTGNCPGGTVSQVDTDAATPGLQATTNVPLGGRVKGSLVVTVRLEDVTSVAPNIPFRCTIDVTAVAVDTSPDPDDAANPENNETQVQIDVTDRNDL